MQIAADSLLLVLANLDNLAFERSCVLEQLNAGTGGPMPFLGGNAGQSDQKEKRKSDGNLPSLNRWTGIRLTQHEVRPRPKNAGQTGDSKSAFVVTDPNREHNRHAVEEDQRYLVPGGQIQPANKD